MDLQKQNPLEKLRAETEAQIRVLEPVAFCGLRSLYVSSELDELRELRAALEQNPEEDPEAHISAMCKALHNENFRLRMAAAERLGDLAGGNSSVSSELMAAVADRISEVAKAAINALGRIENPDDQTVDCLLEVVLTEPADLGNPAASALRGFSARNEHILQVITDAVTNATSDHNAVLAAKCCPPSSLPCRRIMAALGNKDGHWWVREHAFALLSEAAPFPPELVYRLVKAHPPKNILLKIAEDPAVRTRIVTMLERSAARAKYNCLYEAEMLGLLGERAPELVSLLVQRFGESTPEDAQSRAGELLKLGTASAEYLPSFFDALRHEEWRVRLSAVRLVAAAGGPTEEVLAALESMASDSEEHVRSAVHEGMYRIAKRHPATLRVLRVHLDDGNRFVREEAIKMLGEMAGARTHAMQALLEGMKSDSRSVREASTCAFGSSPGRKSRFVAEKLAAMLEADSDSDRRSSFVSHLADMGSTGAPAVPLLNSIVVSPDEDQRIREAAADALAKITAGTDSSVGCLTKALMDQLKEEPEELNVSLCQSLIEALGEIGPPAAPAVPVMVGLATHSGWLKVDDALEKINPPDKDLILAMLPE